MVGFTKEEYDPEDPEASLNVLFDREPSGASTEALETWKSLPRMTFEDIVDNMDDDLEDEYPNTQSLWTFDSESTDDSFRGAYTGEIFDLKA